MFDAIVSPHRTLAASGDPRDLRGYIHRHQDDFDSFAVVNLRALDERLKLWRTHFPSIQPYYAVKAFPDPKVVERLADLGANFDCASKGEIKLVAPLIDNPEERIIFAQPAKIVSHIQTALKLGVRMMTFDNEEELRKIIRTQGEYTAKLVLRILAVDGTSAQPLGYKFGARYEDALKLVEICAAEKLNLIGISFHVGSGATTAMAYCETLKRTAALFDHAKSKGLEMTFLDIGGGFPGLPLLTLSEVDQDRSELFDNMAIAINDSVRDFFSPNVKVISEPGRFFATPCVKIVARVVSKETAIDEDYKKIVEYNLSEGVFGCFANVINDNAKPNIMPFICAKQTGEKFISTFLGPSSREIDVIRDKIEMHELHVGDWIMADNMGAYSLACSPEWNGFDPAAVLYCDVDEHADSHAFQASHNSHIIMH